MTEHTDLIERLRYEPTASQYLSLADLIASLHEDRKNAANALEAQAREIEGLRAARMAYAREFPFDAEGEPDVGSIHQNIRAMKAEAERLRAELDRAHKVAALIHEGLKTIPQDEPVLAIRALNTEGEGNDRP